MIDDTIPFKKKIGDFADKIESYRQKFNERRKQTRVGTFAGLEDAIMKRKKEAQNAQRDSH